MKRHRSVLTRLERVKLLEEKGSLKLSEMSVLGLPKVKHLKIRMKKEKAAAAPGTPEAAASPEAGAAAAPASGSKGPSKPAGSSVQKSAAPPSSKSEASGPSKKKE